MMDNIITTLIAITVFTFSGMLLGIIKTTLTVALAPLVVAISIALVSFIWSKLKKKKGSDD